MVGGNETNRRLGLSSPVIIFLIIASAFMFLPSVSASHLSTLYLTVVSPQAGTTLVRGSNVSLAVLVREFDGDPVSSASVSATLPGNAGSAALSQGGQPGLYSTTYVIRWSDPTGVWIITYQATDDSGRSGSTSISVTITASAVIVQQLVVSDSSGQIRSSYYNDERVAFSIYAGYPDGTSVTSGATSIQLIDPNGQVAITLAAIYVPASNGFVTVTGYEFSPSSPLGAWSARVPVNGLDDGYGNRGPSTPLTAQFMVSAAPTGFGYRGGPLNFTGSDLISAALFTLGAVIPVVALKRRGKKEREDEIDLLVNLARSSGFTLLEGTNQTGKSTIVYQAIENYARRAEPCILLTFEIPPSEVLAQMSQLGIDAESLKEKGLLRLIDCSKVSESINLKFIRSQLLKELEMTTPAKAVFIDSLNLLFDDLSENSVSKFLSALVVEMKGRGGGLWATIAHNGFSRELIASLEGSAGLVLQAEKTAQSRVGPIPLRIVKTRPENSPLTGRRLFIPLIPGSRNKVESEKLEIL